MQVFSKYLILNLQLELKNAFLLYNYQFTKNEHFREKQRYYELFKVFQNSTRIF